jgi:hypothetical protein
MQELEAAGVVVWHRFQREALGRAPDGRAARRERFIIWEPIDFGKGGTRRVFKSSEFTRTERERLVDAGFLREVIRGWLITSRPEERTGDTISWYSSFWQFCRVYLDDRFGTDWVVSAENSITLLAANLNVPNQVIVSALQANNQPLQLPHGTSLYLLRVPKLPVIAVETAGVRTFPAAEALCSVAPAFSQNNKTDVIALLGSIRGTSTILRVLLEGGHTLAAGRIASAYRLLGNARAADEIVSTMDRAGHKVREDENPFKAPVPMQLAGARPASPIVTRIRLMWNEMRDQVLQSFNVEPRLINTKTATWPRSTSDTRRMRITRCQSKGIHSARSSSRRSVTDRGIQTASRATESKRTPWPRRDTGTHFRRCASPLLSFSMVLTPPRPSKRST